MLVVLVAVVGLVVVSSNQYEVVGLSIPGPAVHRDAQSSVLSARGSSQFRGGGGVKTVWVGPVVAGGGPGYLPSRLLVAIVIPAGVAAKLCRQQATGDWQQERIRDQNLPSTE